MSEEKISSEARIKFSLKSKEFEIFGSEDFVNNQIQNFKEMIQSSFGKLLLDEDKPQIVLKRLPNYPHPMDNYEDTETIDYEEKTEKEKQPLSEYENVLVIDGDRVKVIADVPGTTTSSKMINVILLYMWGKLKLGNEEVSFKELREVCEEYGDIDKSNFSSIINKQKKLFLVNGSGQSQTAKLIRPGIKIAEELLKQLNHG